MTHLLFTDVNALDGTRAEPFPGQVLIEGERIAEVWHAWHVSDASASTARRPADARAD